MNAQHEPPPLKIGPPRRWPLAHDPDRLSRMSVEQIAEEAARRRTASAERRNRPKVRLHDEMSEWVGRAVPRRMTPMLWALVAWVAILVLLVVIWWPK